MGRFSVDAQGRICLAGEPIEVRRVTLTKFQTFAVALGAFSAFGMLPLAPWSELAR